MEKIFERLQKIKNAAPLIHHITNYVTVRDCADITKCFGASPVMADAIEEVEEITANSGAVVLNIGTLNDNIIESMKVAGKTANKKSIPVILDVCGMGATKFRNNKCKELLSTFHSDIVKGNISEIAAISGLNIKTKGVDSTKIEINKIDLAKHLAEKLKSVIVITGEQDIISNGNKTYMVKNGCDIMGKVVGTGCMATSIIASFCAIEKDFVLACVSALVCYEICAELAKKESNELGTFKVKLFDKISYLNEPVINKMKKISL